MNEGHEECWRAHLTPDGFAKGGIMPHSPRCDRTHLDPIYAYDATGTAIGYLVADHCQCCGEIIRRPDFL
jgi:hypothetical protein